MWLNKKKLVITFIFLKLLFPEEVYSIHKYRIFKHYLYPFVTVVILTVLSIILDYYNSQVV